MSMAKQGPKTAVPRLRFPEFCNAAEWEWKTLSHVCDMRAGKFIAASEISERPDERSYPCYGGNGLRGYTAGFTHSGRFPLIGRQGALCGNIQFVEGDFYATEHALVASPKAETDVGWLRYTLDGLNLNRFATGQAQPGLSVDVLNGVSCAVPGSESEQQKIADCLASLDEVIAAQGRKVEALKAHKRGLMQQLFPREGETRPRLRFPEFRNAPDWRGGALGHVCDMQAGKFVSASDISEQPSVGKFPCYGGNGLRGYTNSSTHSGEFPLIGRQGAHCGNVQFARGQFHATEHAVVASPKNGVSVAWLYYALEVLDLNRYATGQAQPGLSVDVLKAVPCSIPETEVEQNRIAHCLSSLDTQIAAESNQLAALKTHKQGLMQQLFPAPDAASA
ncbi:MAG TPA: restriction endonuclease subunit S [Dokdonella sp.]|uniref:restriction endonuclease subunit S n=1 Tax=Dokdonella sp. TaxID=2291710 RepID=UPI002D7EA398|nr:restriction endonuclease subunit S [Dokdonella sp.]HET9033556.1 restriction endonuclease subunit S [Dokdonella sp.]